MGVGNFKRVDRFSHTEESVGAGIGKFQRSKGEANGTQAEGGGSKSKKIQKISPNLCLKQKRGGDNLGSKEGEKNMARKKDFWARGGKKKSDRGDP